MPATDTTETHFGFEQIPLAQKQQRVASVFSSVAEQYDLMNDLMSFALHRLWKQFAITVLQCRSGHKVLDLAGGTGDISIRMHPYVSGKNGRIVLADINPSMLQIARQRLLDCGLINEIELIEANAENLPFDDHSFDRQIIGFGLRNVTDKIAALRAMQRVAKPGGRCAVLEFSEPRSMLLKRLYDAYSFNVMPRLGQWVAGDKASYQYLVESIRMHPNQESLRQLMLEAGFDQVNYYNLSGGIVAVHVGIKY